MNQGLAHSTAAPNMNVRGIIGTVLMTLCRGQGEDLSLVPRTAASNGTNGPAITNAAIEIVSLTNKAQMALSKLRGVQPELVKLRAGPRENGPFEIDIAGVKDCEKEAAELSKELGSEAVVIFDHVSPDGATRTNWSFRSGTGRKVIAPAAPIGLGANAKRLYVWPQSSSRPAAPTGIRVRTRLDE